MKAPSTAWLAVIALAALLPAALRSAVWLGHRPPAVDLAMSQAGQELFRHEWTPGDKLAAGGDGLGPVFNANSCVACHFRSGAGGSGTVSENVTTFAVRPSSPSEKQRQGVVHAQSTVAGRTELLADVDAALPKVSRPSLEMLVPVKGMPRALISVPEHVQLAQLHTPALFGANLIDAIPERVILANERRERIRWGLASASDEAPVGRASRLANGRIGRFGWKGQTASLSAFVRAACANELGLGNPNQPQPRPLFDPDYSAPGLDLTAEQCDQLTAFVAALPRPVERVPDEPADAASSAAGKQVFNRIGCADCHTPDLGSVPGLYSDLLLHRMSPELQAGSTSYGSPQSLEAVPDIATDDGPLPREWRTPPLWGVADSAPYLHDGRADTLEEAIQLHGGQAKNCAGRFSLLTDAERQQLIAFLKTLRAPAEPATAATRQRSGA